MTTFLKSANDFFKGLVKVLLRRLDSNIDTNQDGSIEKEELVVWSLRALFNISGDDALDDWKYGI